jgi:hypothetical protein
MLRSESLTAATAGGESDPSKAEEPTVRAADPFRKPLRLEKHWLANWVSRAEFISLDVMHASSNWYAREY